MEEICSLCKKCPGWKGGIPSSILIPPKHYNNHENQEQAPLLYYNKSDQCIPISTNNDSGETPDATIRQASDSGSVPTEQKGGNTCGIGPHPRKDEPTPANPDRIKAASIAEYGVCGWVDSRKIANTLKLPLPEVEAWLQAHYLAFERDGGGIGYRQKRAGEARA